MRGIGNCAAQAKAAGATQLVSSSGGNAGLAAARAGRVLGLRTTVVVPQITGELARKLPFHQTSI